MYVLCIVYALCIILIFTLEIIDTDNFNTLLEITELVSGIAEIQTQDIYLQSTHASPLRKD